MASRAVNAFDPTALLPVKLIGTQPFDSPHRTLAARTEPEHRRLRRSCWKGHSRCCQQVTTQRKESPAPAIGQQPEVVDARETTRQNVLKKAPQELLMGQRHHAALAVVGVIFPAEGHLRIRDIDQPMIRDRDTVGVASQIMQHMFRPAKGLLGVHDPVFTEQGSQETGESLRFNKSCAGSEEDEFVSTEREPQARHKLAAKHPAQNLHWQEEVIGSPDPVLMIRRQPAAGYDAVNVRMRLKRLAPGMQNAEEPDLCTQMLGIVSHLQQRGRTGLEKQLEESLLVLPDEWHQCVRNAEDQVIVIYRQQFLLASSQPLVSSVGLAPRAMTIAAGVVRDGLMTAVIALVTVSTQCRSPASFNRVEYLNLGPSEALFETPKELPARLADDISHLPGWPLHDGAFSEGSFDQGSSDTVIWSRGLTAACKCRRERWR